MSNPQALKEDLIQSDEEFRRLHEQHQELERRLAELQEQATLSQEAELEEKQLKVHKLRLKDRMEAILRGHREAGVSA